MITVRRRRPPKTGAAADPHGEVPDSPDESRQAHVYEGRLQGVGNGHVLGWCCNLSAPDEPIRVTIVVDGEIVAEGSADTARPNLADRWEGARGFLIALPESLQAPGRHRVLALVGPEQTPLEAASSFWYDAGSSEGWSDVVFEPGEPSPSGALPAIVPKPPVSPDPQAVVCDGWLFDAREFEPFPEPTPAELDAIVSTLTATAATCAALGVGYLPVIIPAKRHVVGTAPPSDHGWISALNARLGDVDEVELLDLLPVLRDAARHGAVYHHTDADWNDRGAFFVARALLKEAHKRVPALRPGALADLHLCPVPGYRGTLADAPKMALVDDELIECELDVEAEDGIVIDAHKLHALRMPVEAHLAQASSTHLRVYETAEDKDAHIAVVSDSASLPLVLWLAERTRRTTFFWSDALPPLAQLELELPQVIFHLVRETDLLSSSPSGEAILSEPTPSERALELSTSPVHPTVSAPIGRDTVPGESTPPYQTALSHLLTLAPSPRDTAIKLAAVLRTNAWTIALVLALAALSWPYRYPYILIGSGLDESWVIGLNLALAHGLSFGQQVIFTYGPLGTSMSPQLVTGGTFLLAVFVAFAVQIALVVVLLRCLRRSMGLIPAAFLTLVATSLLSSIQADPLVAIAFGAVSLTLTSRPRDAGRSARALAAGGALLSVIAILVKLNDGVTVAVIVTVGLAAGSQPRRYLKIGAASGLIALVFIWLLLGQPLGALPDYLRNGGDVVKGYVDAMGIDEGTPGSQWQLWLLLASTAALATAAWTALPLLDLRRRLGLLVAVLLAHYFLLREIFVRYDSTRGVYMALLIAIALMVPWPRGRRALGIAIAFTLAVGMFASFPKSPTQLVNPEVSAKALLSDFHDALSAGARAPIYAQSRQIMGKQDALPPSMLAAVRGPHCVTVEPTEIAVVWLYGLRWCPLPALQSYNAYTARLDHLDAGAYADARHGPDRVLRQDSTVDGRNPTWESPAAMLSLLCHFGELTRAGNWQLLARIPDRCGKPHTLAVIHGSLGKPITLPEAPPGDVLVASVNGLQVAGWERLDTLFTRAAVRTVSINGNSFRVPPDTADDGLVVGVPAAANYAPPFNFNMDPHTLEANVQGHSSGPITVRLTAVPIASSTLSEARPLHSTYATSSGFRPDTHRLPWLYKGQRLLTPTQIMSLPEPERELADSALLNAENLPLEQPNAQGLHAAIPAVPIRRPRGLNIQPTPITGTSHGCTQLTPNIRGGDAAIVSVPPGHGLYLSMHQTGQVSIYVLRLAKHVPSKPLHVLPNSGTPTLMRFPRDTSTLPWHVRLVPTTPLAVCIV